MSVTERIRMFATESGRRFPTSSSELGYYFVDQPLRINVFMEYIYSLAFRKQIFSGKISEVMRGNKLYIILVRGDSARRDGHCTPYVSHLTMMLRTQGTFCGKEDFMFSPGQRRTSTSVVFSSMTMVFIRTYYEEMKEVLEFQTEGICSLRRSTKMWSCSWEVIQFISDMTAATLEITALVAYSVHSTFFNVSARRAQRLIHRKYELVTFSPVYCGERQIEEERSRADEEISKCKLTTSMTVPPESGV